MIAVDQFGSVVHLPGKTPRKELLAQLGATHSERVYVDTAAGTKHIGYTVHGRWFTLYTRREVTP